MNSNACIVMTSCDRLDLLERTLRSFMEFNTYPIKELIIRDDSGISEIWGDTGELLMDMRLPFPFRLLEVGQLGQTESIDTMMRTVSTPYIVHMEDDWDFYGDFVEKAIRVLEDDSSIVQVWIRPIDDSPVKRNLKYYQEGSKDYSILIPWGDSNGWSFNPHVRRIKDWKPYTDYPNIGATKEDSIGRIHISEGRKTAWLMEGYCKHTGWTKTTNRSGTPYHAGVKKA
jgi:hypothetical protein